MFEILGILQYTLNGTFNVEITVKLWIVPEQYIVPFPYDISSVTVYIFKMPCSLKLNH